jgi:hypothetical protein
VIVPDQVRDLMEKRARESGDGPIPVIGVTLDVTNSGNYIYSVRTKAMPDGIPVTVLPTEDGPKVDWEAFISFHDDDFRKFCEGPVGNSGIFLVFARPDPPEGGEAESHFMRFLLSVPMPNRAKQAYVRKNSTVMPKLQGVFDGSGHFNKDQVNEMVSKSGVPMVLGLEKKSNGVGQNFLEITQYVALGWGPRHE